MMRKSSMSPKIPSSISGMRSNGITRYSSAASENMTKRNRNIHSSPLGEITAEMQCRSTVGTSRADWYHYANTFIAIHYSRQLSHTIQFWLHKNNQNNNICSSSSNMVSIICHKTSGGWFYIKIKWLRSVQPTATFVNWTVNEFTAIVNPLIWQWLC